MRPILRRLSDNLRPVIRKPIRTERQRNRLFEKPRPVHAHNPVRHRKIRQVHCLYPVAFCF